MNGFDFGGNNCCLWILIILLIICLAKSGCLNGIFNRYSLRNLIGGKHEQNNKNDCSRRNHERADDSAFYARNGNRRNVDNAAGGTFAVGAIRILLFLRLEIRIFKRRGIRLVVARNRFYRGESFVYNSHNIRVAESYHGDSGLRNIQSCENVVR